MWETSLCPYRSYSMHRCRLCLCQANSALVELYFKNNFYEYFILMNNRLAKLTVFLFTCYDNVSWRPHYWNEELREEIKFKAKVVFRLFVLFRFYFYFADVNLNLTEISQNSTWWWVFREAGTRVVRKREEKI